MPTPIDPKRIRTDLDTQSRVALNEETVKEYAEAMEAGQEFPAPLVFYDEPKDEYILADGFHRHASHMRVKPNDMILVELRLGTVEDARWESIGSNKSHGLRRTNEDKRNAIKKAIVHPIGVKKTDRGIAKHVGVDHKTVGNVRNELQLSGEIPQIEIRIVERGDQVYQQDTSRIGSAKTTPPAGATCAICSHFDKTVCLRDDSEPLPWSDACEHFEANEELVQDETAPKAEKSGKSGKPSKKNPNQYRRLKGCATLYLPTDNAQLFAVELRNRFPPPYLTACIAALKHLLTDKGD